MKHFEYVLKGKNQLAPTVAQLFLQPVEDALLYEAGQFCEIEFPDGQLHPYSMANRPREDGVLEFHVRQGMHEVDVFLSHLEEKKPVILSNPSGKGTLSSHDYMKPLILVAGGTGFAPYKAILEQAEVDQVAYPIHLFWGVDREVDWYLKTFLEEITHRLTQFQYTLIHTLKDPSQPRYAHEALASSYDDLTEVNIYVSGPWGMVEAVQSRLKPEGCFYSDMLSSEEGLLD